MKNSLDMYHYRERSQAAHQTIFHFSPKNMNNIRSNVIDNLEILLKHFFNRLSIEKNIDSFS